MAANAEAESNETLSRPMDMPLEMYNQLSSDYQTARNTYNRSVSRECQARTIARNLAKRDAEHQKLLRSLATWKSSAELRAAVQASAASTAEVVGLLQGASVAAIERHTAVMGALELIQGALNVVGPAASSSSSSSSDNVVVPMDVDVPTAVDEDLSIVDQCFICLSGVSQGVKLPCCWRGGHIAHTECYTEMLWTAQSDSLKCPVCKTAFKDFGMDSQDAEQRQRYRSFMRSLCLPQEWLTFLVEDNGAPMDVVMLVSPYNATGPSRHFHLALKALPNSKVSSNFSPLWVDLSTESAEGLKAHYHRRLDQISVKGDDIHAFVDRACQGTWPAFDVLVKLTCFGHRFPYIYNFQGFRKSASGEGSYANLQVMDPHDAGEEQYEDDDLTIRIPLSAIETFQPHSRCPIVRKLNEVGDEDWLPVEVIIGLQDSPTQSSWQRVWVLNVDRGGHAPRLVIATDRDSPFQRRVSISSVLSLERECTPRNHPFHVHSEPRGGLPRVYVANIIVKLTAPEPYKSYSSLAEYTILGYTYERYQGLQLNTLQGRLMTKIPVQHISHVRFLRA
jgi:hypothetical protein